MNLPASLPPSWPLILPADHHEERAHTIRSRGAHRIGRARHLPERTRMAFASCGSRPDQRELVTLVGHAAAISAGEWITAAGHWVNDRTHGQQFKARLLKTSTPTSAEDRANATDHPRGQVLLDALRNRPRGVGKPSVAPQFNYP